MQTFIGHGIENPVRCAIRNMQLARKISAIAPSQHYHKVLINHSHKSDPGHGTNHLITCIFKLLWRGGEKSIAFSNSFGREGRKELT